MKDFSFFYIVFTPKFSLLLFSKLLNKALRSLSSFKGNIWQTLTHCVAKRRLRASPSFATRVNQHVQMIYRPSFVHSRNIKHKKHIDKHQTRHEHRHLDTDNNFRKWHNLVWLLVLLSCWYLTLTRVQNRDTDECLCFIVKVRFSQN